MRLVDYLIDPIVYTAYFLKSLEKAQLDIDSVRTNIVKLMDDSKVAFEMASNNMLMKEKEFELAHFAVCALIDEAILTSTWIEREKWKGQQLQLHYYNTTNAGEEFFDKLNELPLDQKDVREVYSLCLALGFKGQFHDARHEGLLESLRTKNLRYILGSSVGLPSLERIELFPEAYPQESSAPRPLTKKKEKTVYSFLAILFVAAPVIFLLLLFIIYHFLLDAKGDKILDMII